MRSSRNYAALSRHDQAVLLRWASTSVENLAHDAVLCLVASAFLPPESLLAWPALIALALFGSNNVLGNRRTMVVCAAAHVAGTLCVPETSSTLCDQAVFVDQAIDASSFTDAVLAEIDRLG